MLFTVRRLPRSHCSALLPWYIPSRTQSLSSGSERFYILRSLDLQNNSTLATHYYNSCGKNKVRRRYALGKHYFSTEAMTAGSESRAQLEKALTSTVLEAIREFWFQHLDREELFIFPGHVETKRWFSKNVEFDESCLKDFSCILETIKISGATVTEVLAVAKPSSPLDWLSIILLLDQISRNCYRGLASRVVFEVFDPLARAIALRAIEDGIPQQSPLIRYRIAYRFWFYLPLMHSEDTAIHQVAFREFERMSNDIQELVDKEEDVSRTGTNELKCRAVLIEHKEAAKGFCANLLDFEKRHKVIIGQFGRYPHRNKALCRIPTKEEESFLEAGGDTFG